MNFKVSAKVNGKWWTFGNIKTNQYGNLSLSFKNTQQLKDFVNNGGDWLNFSLFEDNGQKQTPHNQAKQDGYQPQPAAAPDLDDEIPFAFVLPLIGGMALLSNSGLTSYLV